MDLEISTSQTALQPCSLGSGVICVSDPVRFRTQKRGRGFASSALSAAENLVSSTFLLALLVTGSVGVERQRAGFLVAAGGDQQEHVGPESQPPELAF